MKAGLSYLIWVAVIIIYISCGGVKSGHVQLVQLLRAFGDGPSLHALAKHGSPASPRRARPTRRIPLRSQAVRPSLHWCAAERQGRIRPPAHALQRCKAVPSARPPRQDAGRCRLVTHRTCYYPDHCVSSIEKEKVIWIATGKSGEVRTQNGNNPGTHATIQITVLVL